MRKVIMLASLVFASIGTGGVANAAAPQILEAEAATFTVHVADVVTVTDIVPVVATVPVVKAAAVAVPGPQPAPEVVEPTPSYNGISCGGDPTVPGDGDCQGPEDIVTCIDAQGYPFTTGRIEAAAFGDTAECAL